MKRGFTPTLPLHNSIYYLSSNHRKRTIFQPITLNCSRHDELGEECGTRFSSPNFFFTKIISINNNMGLDRESISTIYSITRKENTSRLSFLLKPSYSHMKHGFTPMSPLHNSTDCPSSNDRKYTTLKPTTLNYFKQDELGEESGTRFSSSNSFITNITSTNDNMGLDHESTSTIYSITREESISKLPLLSK